MWKIALTSRSPKLPITGHNLFKVESRFSLTKIPFRNIIKKNFLAQPKWYKKS